MDEVSDLTEVGYGQADITPPVGTPLSGFVSRENRPSTGIDSQLYVHALALRSAGHLLFLLSYELLGLGPELQGRIETSLKAEIGGDFDAERCLLVSVHNHSGPSTGMLLGDAVPAEEYLERLVSQSVFAASLALNSLCPAHLYVTERNLPGLTYNRRAILPDGRVSIAPFPDLPVVQRGPLDDRLTLLVWRDLNGRDLVGLIHYACHGVAVLAQTINGDIPGELTAKIGEQLGAPCLFLQGAAGDVNPTTVTAGWVDLQAWLKKALTRLSNLDAGLRPVQDLPVKTVNHSLLLEYATLPARAEAQRNLDDLLQIAEGDSTSSSLQVAIQSFRNTLNLTSDAVLDPAKTRFVAMVLVEHARRVLAAVQEGKPLAPQPMHICSWQVGEYVLVFMAAEIFTSTGIKIRSLDPGRSILPISCLAPLVGYLPDREALALGGYEVNDAWRFYGQLSPFSSNSEERLVDEIAGIIQTTHPQPE